MFTSFICGSFHEQDFEDDGTLRCGDSPRSIKKSRAKSREENPYSQVGLDKFSALLSDLDEKKKNIYLQRDSRDIMFVRFVYSGSEEVVPIIVKWKDRKRKQGVVGQKKDELRRGNNANKQATAAAERAKEGLITEPNDKKMVTKKLRSPWYYVPISVVLILFLLVIFGRSFAILCVAIGWYLVPTLTDMTDETTTSCGSVKKKMTTAGVVSRATSPRGK